MYYSCQPHIKLRSLYSVITSLCLPFDLMLMGIPFYSIRQTFSRISLVRVKSQFRWRSWWNLSVVRWCMMYYSLGPAIASAIKFNLLSFSFRLAPHPTDHKQQIESRILIKFFICVNIFHFCFVGIWKYWISQSNENTHCRNCDSISVSFRQLSALVHWRFL